jgi:hypothetical protein
MRVLAGSRFQFGRAGIYFQHYNNRPPMNDPNNKRLLMAKLNAIEGVEITADQFDPRLSFDLLLLRGERLDGFLAAFG